MMGQHRRVSGTRSAPTWMLRRLHRRQFLSMGQPVGNCSDRREYCAKIAVSVGAVMAGKAKHLGHGELAGQVAALREQVRAESRAASAAGRERTAARRGAHGGRNADRGGCARGRATGAKSAATMGESEFGAGLRAAATVSAGPNSRAARDAEATGGYALNHCPHCAAVLRQGRVVGHGSRP
jgi:type IV secretory pathway TrbL component